MPWKKKPMRKNYYFKTVINKRLLIYYSILNFNMTIAIVAGKEFEDVLLFPQSTKL